MRHLRSVHSRQELRDTRQHQITAEKGVGMAETGQGEERDVRYITGTFLVLHIDRIILACKQQARHGHRWQDHREARTLKHLGQAGYESLHVVPHQPRF